MARAKQQGQGELVFRTHGGRRAGAGRKAAGPRASERHGVRSVHDRRHPAHVTIRIVRDVGNLRRRDTYLALHAATAITARREDFRIVHLSIQRDHLHLIVEADHRAALSAGMQGFAISAARRINRAISARTDQRRIGQVVADRFHARPLTSPRAVRNALAYVLGNWRRHGEDLAHFARRWGVDPFSSGAVFTGWKELESSPVLWPLPDSYDPLLVVRPRTWLLRNWDRFHPLISVREVPGARA
ncbi:MAG TPA: transposase [Kofleriaceae bacterium]|nr:transposase [Kofleriaceae bacterium]